MKTRSLICLSLIPLALLNTLACDEPAPSDVTGVPVPAPRLDNDPPTTAPLTIDDFEDEDLSFLTRDGSGHWAATPADAALGVESDGADGTASALHLTASGGASAAALLSPGDTPLVINHDLTSCAGVELWIKRGGAPGGALELVVSSASGDGRVSLEPTSEWQKLSFAFAEFAPSSAPMGQAGAAGAAGGASEPAPAGALDLESVRGIRLEATGAVDVWLDEIAFTDCEIPDINPPLPAPPALGSKGPAGSPVAEHGQLAVKGGRIVDQSGAPYQLRGVSSMWLNQSAMPYADSKEGLRYMRDEWGLTVIRAAMGAEAGPRAYLSDPAGQRRHAELIIQNAIDLGVYVIMDWHDHNPHPAEARGFFAEMAERYGEEPNVIWEVYNEPKKEDWSTQLKPYHASLVETIRARDADNLIVLGTSQWSQKVEDAALDPLGATNVLYTLHFYSCTHTDWLRSDADFAARSGLPMFVTEFGATAADGGLDGLVCEDEARAWFTWMAENGVSGAAWKFDSCPDSSCILASGAGLNGGWTDAQLQGHGPLIRAWIQGTL